MRNSKAVTSVKTSRTLEAMVLSSVIRREKLILSPDSTHSFCRAFPMLSRGIPEGRIAPAPGGLWHDKCQALFWMVSLKFHNHVL